MKQYTHNDLDEMFGDYLRDSCEQDCGASVVIFGIEFDPADVVRKMDPVAYRYFYYDWLDDVIQDGYIFEHSDGTYWDSEEEGEDEDVALKLIEY